MEDVVVFLVPLGFFAMIAYIAKVIGDTRVRRKLTEARVSADVADRVLRREWREPGTRSALKWGLVVLALGVGVLIVDLFAIGFESPLAYALLLLATGMALLGFYAIERGADDTGPAERPEASAGTSEEAAPEDALEPVSSEPVQDPEQ